MHKEEAETILRSQEFEDALVNGRNPRRLPTRRELLANFTVDEQVDEDSNTLIICSTGNGKPVRACIGETGWARRAGKIEDPDAIRKMNISTLVFAFEDMATAAHS